MSSPGPIRTAGSAPAYRPNLASTQYRSNYSSPIGPPPFGGTQPVPGKRYPYPTNGRRPYYSSPYYYGSGLYVGYPGYGYGYSDDSRSKAELAATKSRASVNTGLIFAFPNFPLLTAWPASLCPVRSGSNALDDTPGLNDCDALLKCHYASSASASPGRCHSCRGRGAASTP